MTHLPPTARRRTAIAASPRLHVALVLVVIALGAACLDPPRDRGTLAVPTAEAARERAFALLTFAKDRDVAGVRGGLCAPLGAQAGALLEPGQALAIEAFSIAGVEPVWIGGEPAFHIAVDLTRNGALLPRGLRVRSREGCVDELLDAPPHAPPQEGAPVTPQPPDPSEISL